MNRADMISYIQKAKDLPVAMRVAANLFLSQMTDDQVNTLAVKASSAMEFVKNGDKAGYQKAIADAGLSRFIEPLTRIAFPDGEAKH